jgi:sulfopropanediol 3-dehydrogenase
MAGSSSASAWGPALAEYLKRSELPPQQTTAEVKATVAEMLAKIEQDGIEAIRSFSAQLDNWEPRSFQVSPEAIEAAADQIDDELKEHIAFAQEQVRSFAQHQRDSLLELSVNPLPGVELGHRHVPIEAVGSYIPGGRYPMLASAFMTVIVPKVAGVDRVVAAAPPRDSNGIHPAMLYAMATSGADQILCIGGVQALAAMVHGIEEVDPVDMIVGAGNAYVAEAKRQLYGRVGIDLMAGPTEVLVLAEDEADPALIAADLLGQAEHGPGSPAVLVTTSESLGRAVLDEVERLLPEWPTAEVAGEAWRDRGEVAIVADREEAIALADEYAYEHVEVHANDQALDEYLGRLRNYGSLFLGEHSTVAYGDKAIGTNHVLPTARAARYTGGLWVGKFLKTLTYQRMSDEGTVHVAPAVAAISEAELFGGHALTATMRLERRWAKSAG